MNKEECKKEKEGLQWELQEELKEDLLLGKKEIKKAFEETIDPNGDKKISLQEIFGEMFSIKKDVADKAQIRESLVSGGRITGTNMCLLVLAILIASIGLNVNSTAVIIGAMLVSPLMGTIHAFAYGTATSDRVLAVRSMLGFIMQILISLCASTLYFLITPLSDATSELLARTQPTIWDVLIAVCGGIAGIIGVTRKEKTNVIPGVAIATALMPPLCTCGYSIAHGQWRMLLGAGYLFAANSYFIYLSAVIILIILGVPKVKCVDEKRAKKMRRKLIRNTIIMILPSILVAYLMLQEASEDETALTGFETAIDISELSDEMEVLFPEVKGISVGQLEELDEEGNPVQKKVIMLEMENDSNTGDDKQDDNQDVEQDAEQDFEQDFERIKSWLMGRYEEYDVKLVEVK